MFSSLNNDGLNKHVKGLLIATSVAIFNMIRHSNLHLDFGPEQREFDDDRFKIQAPQLTLCAKGRTIGKGKNGRNKKVRTLSSPLFMMIVSLTFSTHPGV